jgi:probable O-glycosylation ligase (exosortase A-associated)
MFSSTIAALLVVEWFTLLSPFNFVYGAVTQIPLYYTAFISAVLSVVIFRHKLRSPLTSVTWVIILLLLDGLLATLAAPAINEDSSSAQLVIILKVAMNFFCIMTIVSTRARLHALAITFVLGLGFYGLTDGLKYLASGGSHVVYGVPQLGDNNSYGMAMLMVAPVAYYISRCLAARWVRAGFVAVSGLAVATAVGTLSRGAFIALIGMGFLFVVRSKKRFRNLIIVLIASGLIAAVATQRWTARIDTLATAQDDGSFLSRVTMWKLSWVIAVDRPLTGLGFHGLQNTTLWHSYIPKFKEWFPDGDISRNHGFVAHSVVFQTLSDLGFPGLFLFLSLIGMSFANIIHVKRKARASPELQWMDELASGFELSLVGYAVAGLALSVAYFEPFFILISMIAALRRLAAEAAVEQSPASKSVRITAGSGSSYRRADPRPYIT